MSTSRKEILRIASAQKMLLRTILFVIAAYLSPLVLYQAVEMGILPIPRRTPPIVDLTMGVCVIATIVTILVAQISSVIRLCLALEERWAMVTYVTMQFAPCLSVVFLLFLNKTATNRLVNAGIRVGLLGANSHDLKNYRPPSPDWCSSCGEPIDPTKCPMCGEKLE